MKLLVVEDDPDVFDVLMEVISEEYPDVTVYSARDGKTGLDLFEKHRPAIVITDLDMPVMDGCRMAEKIRSLDADTRFIVQSGRMSNKHLERLKGIGVCTYLPKPFRFQELLAAIDKCIDEVEINCSPTPPRHIP
jgi:DNA-binding response OmpR family regulator